MSPFLLYAKALHFAKSSTSRPVFHIPIWNDQCNGRERNRMQRNWRIVEPTLWGHEDYCASIFDIEKTPAVIERSVTSLYTRNMGMNQCFKWLGSFDKHRKISCVKDIRGLLLSRWTNVETSHFYSHQFLVSTLEIRWHVHLLECFH